MAYSHTNSRGTTYYLHGKDVTLRNGTKQRIYYFAKEVKEGAIDALPEGREVKESSRTGLPVLGSTAAASAAKAAKTPATKAAKPAAGKAAAAKATAPKSTGKAAMGKATAGKSGKGGAG